MYSENCTHGRKKQNRPRYLQLVHGPEPTASDSIVEPVKMEFVQCDGRPLPTVDLTLFAVDSNSETRVHQPVLLLSANSHIAHPNTSSADSRHHKKTFSASQQVGYGADSLPCCNAPPACTRQPYPHQLQHTTHHSSPWRCASCGAFPSCTSPSAPPHTHTLTHSHPYLNHLLHTNVAPTRVCIHCSMQSMALAHRVCCVSVA